MLPLDECQGGPIAPKRSSRAVVEYTLYTLGMGSPSCTYGRHELSTTPRLCACTNASYLLHAGAKMVGHRADARARVCVCVRERERERGGGIRAHGDTRWSGTAGWMVRGAT